MMTRIVLESKENTFVFNEWLLCTALAMQVHKMITWYDLDFLKRLGNDLKLIESEQSIKGNLSCWIFF